MDVNIEDIHHIKGDTIYLDMALTALCFVLVKKGIVRRRRFEDAFDMSLLVMDQMHMKDPEMKVPTELARHKLHQLLTVL